MRRSRRFPNGALCTPITTLGCVSEPIWTLDAVEIAGLVRTGDVSAKEVLEACIERIEQHNETLNALVYLDFDQAREAATAVDARLASGEDPGPLAGVPLGVKELERVKGWPDTGASIPHRDRIAERDSIETARLRDAGCVLVGLTASPEFGSTAYTRTYLHGTTRNPWNLERTPGGSSGGTAAAVAAGVLPLGTASDGGGSIRIPASFSGLFGAKGTFGRIPKEGAETSYTTAHGCLSRSVRDTARFWDCTVGSHERDPYSLPHPGFSYEAVMHETPNGLRAVWSEDLGYGVSEADVTTASRGAAEALADASGVTWVDRPIELKDMSVAWGLFNHPGTWLDVRDYWPDSSDEFTPPIRSAVRDAEKRFNLAEVARAVERRHENNEILTAAFEDVDVIFTPTTGTTAFGAEGKPPMTVNGRDLRNVMHSLFTFPFNISGHPSFSVPCGFDSDGMPIGLQMTTRRHEDHLLFQLAAVLEQIRPWPKIARDYAG
jgi:aspartyl-tRNA(Asn)/glutamyl-tRNA(Gln) amidotransferase subunit A